VVVDAQPAVRVAWQVTDSRPLIDAVIEKTCSQFPWVAEDDRSLRPPSTQDSGCDNPIQVAVGDNATDV
jgi:hypothetical protein